MISVVLRNLNRKYNPVDSFTIHVCLDANIFLDEIETYFRKGSSEQSVFVLIPVRLGLDSI